MSLHGLSNLCPRGGSFDEAPGPERRLQHGRVDASGLASPLCRSLDARGLTTCPSAAARFPWRGVAHDPDEADAVRSPEACPVVAAEAPGRGPRRLNVRTPARSSARCASAWTPRSRGSARSARCAARVLAWSAWSSRPHFLRPPGVGLGEPAYAFRREGGETRRKAQESFGRRWPFRRGGGTSAAGRITVAEARRPGTRLEWRSVPPGAPARPLDDPAVTHDSHVVFVGSSVVAGPMATAMDRAWTGFPPASRFGPSRLDTRARRSTVGRAERSNRASWGWRR